MDAKDLRTEPALSDRNNDGGKYAQSGGIALQCDGNKSYQDIGSSSLAKVEVQSARPCAVIGPDRVVQPGAGDAYLKKAPADPWPCMDYAYRRPPEYPHKLTNYSSPIRNISPRQTFQENMPRIMVQPSYNSAKMNDDTKYAQIPDRNISLLKNNKLNVPPEAKYNCDVPYSVNPNNNGPKNVRNPEMCVSNVNPSIARTAAHGWPPGSVNLRSVRSYPASELYQYQEYPSCAGPRPIVSRPHRTLPEEPGYVYPDTYYQDGNIRFKPYPNVKDRYPTSRYDYSGSYNSPFHPPPSFPPHKSLPPHPFSPYAPVKYLDNRVAEPILDGYPRNQQGNYNMPYHNQVIHPNYGSVIANCAQNKMHAFPPDGSLKTIAPNKLPYDGNNKAYIEYDNSRPKLYPSDSYFVNEIGRLHPMKSQVLMPNYPNMHAGPSNPYYKKDNAQIKNYEYMSHYRNMDPMLNIHNPLHRHVPMFSPNALPISPTDSSASNDTNLTIGTSQEDCGYVSQSSTASVRSMDSAINRMHSDYFRRYDSRYAHLVRSSPMMAKPELHSSNNTSKDKKNIDVRQFLQMWNEGDEETNECNPKEVVLKTGTTDNKLTKSNVHNNNEQLYVLGLVNVPSDELSKYEHIQKVSKLPENIKGYNSIELLDQFEEAIESSKMSHFKPQISTKGVVSKQLTGMLPRPVSPLDVEAKISQSVIHKEVGCNFEIKPCSPKMLNVEVAAPVHNILAERAIEKVSNPVNIKSPMLNGIEENIDCKLMRRQDHRNNIIDNLRIASCKMINTQFSNINSIEPMKSTYSLQDLESNSGLCRASLPRLDNDMELNFPEVNQQFINANKGESAVLSPAVKDLPTLEVLDQPDTEEITGKKDTAKILKPETKMYHSPLSIDPEKEVSKLSKYRKNKVGGSDEDKKILAHQENQIQDNINAVRTDSVIIKNPDKKLEENSVFSPNMFNEMQEAPMNLTSHVNFELDKKEDYADEYDHSFDIAIDFSLNKTPLFNIKSSEKEINIETENPAQELKQLDNSPNCPAINTDKSRDITDGQPVCHIFNSNNEDRIKLETSLQNGLDIVLHQVNDSSMKKSDTTPIQLDAVVGIDDVDMIKSPRTTIKLESKDKSGSPTSGVLPILINSNDDCFLKVTSGVPTPQNSNDIMKTDKDLTNNEIINNRDIERELETIFNDDNPRSETEEKVIYNNNRPKSLGDDVVFPKDCPENSTKKNIVCEKDSSYRKRRRRRREAKFKKHQLNYDTSKHKIDEEIICGNTSTESKAKTEIVCNNDSSIIKTTKLNDTDDNIGSNIREEIIGNIVAKDVKMLHNNDQPLQIYENEVSSKNTSETKINQEIVFDPNSANSITRDEILCNNYDTIDPVINDGLLSVRNISKTELTEEISCNSYRSETANEGILHTINSCDNRINEEISRNDRRSESYYDVETKGNENIFLNNDNNHSLKPNHFDIISDCNSSEIKITENDRSQREEFLSQNISETHINEKILHNIDSLNININSGILCNNDSIIEETSGSNVCLDINMENEIVVCENQIDVNETNKVLLRTNNNSPESKTEKEISRNDITADANDSSVECFNNNPEPVCSKNSSESKIIGKLEDNIHPNMNMAQMNSDNHLIDTCVNSPPSYDNVDENKLILEDALQSTGSMESQNFAAEKIHHSPSSINVISNEITTGPTNSTPDAPESVQLLIQTEVSDSMDDQNIDLSVQDASNKVSDSILPYDDKVNCKKVQSNLRVWSKERFSPWIQKLVTITEGKINRKGHNSFDINNVLENTIEECRENKSPATNTIGNMEVIEKPEEISYIMSENAIDGSIISTNSPADTTFCVSDFIKKPEEDISNNKAIENLDIFPCDDNETQMGINNHPDKIFQLDADDPNIEKDKNKDTHQTSIVGLQFEDYTKKYDEIEMNKIFCDDKNHSEISPNNAVVFTNPISTEPEFMCDDIETGPDILSEVDPCNTEKTIDVPQEISASIGLFNDNEHTIAEEIILDQHNKEFKNTQCDSIGSYCKRRPHLKRSLSDSVLNDYKNDEKRNENYIQLVWPLKRRKTNNLDRVEPNYLAENLANLIQHNRRNSVSAIYNEDDVSFCILIDDSCIITEEDTEEQKICYTRIEECLELQSDSVNEDNTEIVTSPITSSPQLNIPCECSDSFALNCDEDRILENSWVDDIACVETVISDDIAEDIVISGPLSPKDANYSDNEESGVFTSSEHTEKVKYIYGDKMCSDDALYLETLYKTPQMDVNRTLSSREPQLIEESEEYYDKDSLEKILSDSNRKDSYTPEFVDPIMPSSISNYDNTLHDKENMNIEITDSVNINVNSGSIVSINIDEEEYLQSKLNKFNKAQVDTVYSCESSIDNVFSYKQESNEESIDTVTSSSPEVSSTTSEEKNSSILLKITNYKGSRISEVNGVSSLNNRPSCKFTEEKDYLHYTKNYSKNRPLLTKAAQKYIPPLKESISDLKVKLPLPQDSLLKLKQLKKSKDKPKPRQLTNNNMSTIPKKIKPKFEDVLMSIDQMQFKKHKEKSKKCKQSIPKVVIKKSENGSHYASTSKRDDYNPDLTGRKWQPWVFLEKSSFIDKMAIRKKTKAVYSHRKKCYVLAEKFKKYKSINHAQFIITQPKTDKTSTGLKYTIRLKHHY